MNNTVLMLINSLQGGGAERVFSLLANKIGKKTQIIVVLLDEFPLKYDLRQEVILITLGSKIPGFNLLKFIHVLLKKRPEVVLSFLSRSNFINIFSKFFVSHRTIISERTTPSQHFAHKGLYGQISKSLIKYIYPVSDCIIAVSNGVKCDLVRNFKIDESKVVAVPNPYDLVTINIKGSIEFKNINTEYICAVGRLDGSKRFDLLIRAYAESNIGTVLYILGEGPLRKNLSSLITELDIDDKVQLLGFVDNPYQYLKHSKYFILSSEYEGFPNVLVEALALGKPVIATDCASGPREILDPGFSGEITDVHYGEYGVLVPVADISCLAKAMMQLDHSIAIRSSYQAKVISRAKDFDIDSIYLKYLSVISAQNI